MRMNALIPMQAQGVDVVGSMSRGAQARGQMQQAQTQNALTQFMQEQGPALARGEQGAIDGYARFDPAGAFDMRSRINEAARVAQEQAAAAAEKLDAQQRAAEEANINRILSIVGTAYRQGPEAIEAAKAQYGQALAQANIDPAQLTYDTIPLFVAGLVGAKNGLKAGLDASEALEGGEPKTEAEREIARLVAIGIPEDVAIRIKENVYRLKTNPIDGSHEVIDMATGQPVWGQDEQQAGGVTPEPAPQPTMTMPKYGEAYPNSDQSFGLPGMIKGITNAASDFVVGEPVFPEVDQTQKDFKVLREQLVNDISGGYNRQPPSWLLQEIRDLTPQAGGPQGKGGAQSKLRALGRSLETELVRIERSLSRRMRPAERELLETQAISLRTAMERIDQALSSFDGGASGGNTTSSGVTWSVVE